ncbi:MAG: hypothetical protein ABGY09_03660 [Euryarchaeota archaeon]
MVLIRSLSGEDCRRLLKRSLCEVVLGKIGHRAFACPLGGPPYCHPRDVGKYRPRGFVSMWELEAAGRVLESGRRYLRDEDLYVSCLVCDLLGPVGGRSLPLRVVRWRGRRATALRLGRTGDCRKDGLVELALRRLVSRGLVSVDGEWWRVAEEFLRFAREARDLVEHLRANDLLAIPPRVPRSHGASSR